MWIQCAHEASFSREKCGDGRVCRFGQRSGERNGLHLRHGCADACCAADALIEACGGPGQVEVNDRRDAGQREPFAQHVGRDEQSHDVVAVPVVGVQQALQHVGAADGSRDEPGFVAGKQCDARLCAQVAEELFGRRAELRERDDRSRGPSRESSECGAASAVIDASQRREQRLECTALGCCICREVWWNGAAGSSEQFGHRKLDIGFAGSPGASDVARWLDVRACGLLHADCGGDPVTDVCARGGVARAERVEKAQLEQAVPIACVCAEGRESHDVCRQRRHAWWHRDRRAVSHDGNHECGRIRQSCRVDVGHCAAEGEQVACRGCGGVCCRCVEQPCDVQQVVGRVVYRCRAQQQHFRVGAEFRRPAVSSGRGCSEVMCLVDDHEEVCGEARCGGCAEAFGADEVEGYAGRACGVGPAAAECCGRDHEWSAGEFSRDGEGDIRLSQSGRVGEQCAAVATDTWHEPAYGRHLMRQQRDVAELW